MKYWLLKSEPDVWSIDQQMKSGEKGADPGRPMGSCFAEMQWNNHCG